ncbi:MAG: 2Fe-2S iron-sulfur cluster-binding protein [Planctomycetota bacterium]
MPKLTIDNRAVSVSVGATLLHAARAAGIRIPTLCYYDGLPPLTSCLVCVVRVQGLKRLVPACAFPARDGMVVESETPEVHSARRTALELLIGDHLGDCIAPCAGICPTKMDIPRLMAQLKAGQARAALMTAKELMALPAVLGYVCPAPCENGCRRAQVDAAVSIRLLHRYAAETDLASTSPYLPPCKPASGKKVAIVGAGPAGLSAAWYLLQAGHACFIFDDHDEPGGQLRYGIEPAKLPRAVLDAETALVGKLGAQFRMKQKLGAAFSLAELRRGHDAVLLATGEVSKEAAAALGFELAGRALKAQGFVLPGKLDGIFAAGAALAPGRMAVRAVAAGRLVAVALGQFLAGQPIAAAKEFVIHIGKLDPQELQILMAGVNPGPRLIPDPAQPLTPAQAAGEAARCLQCGCLKEHDCKLRQYAAEYGVQAAKYKGERRRFERNTEHPQAVFERGKCISCGRCVQIAGQASAAPGLAYVGRGFNVRIGVPFNEKLTTALGGVAAECAKACPTAAIAPTTKKLKNASEPRA